jgi:hypothetical protein
MKFQDEVDEVGAEPAHEAVVLLRPLERERVYLDCGCRTTRLMRDPLGCAT